MRAFRLDIGSIGEPQMTPQGYLRTPAYATRVGVFSYRMPDGTVRKELRPPEEVFDEKSLATLGEIPITNDHPPEMLSAKNTRKYAVGYTSRDAQPVDSRVMVGVTITDEDTINQVLDEAKPKRETSCGYSVEIDEAPGEWNGIPYDVVQRCIVYNHLAIVDAGRAGPSVRLKLDRCDAMMVADDAGRMDAEWTAAYVNNLPDAAFAYIEPGGEKDDQGKTTPRSLRHFPHHGASVKNGKDNDTVDVPHLRNALARCPQSEFGDKAMPHLVAHAKALKVGEYGDKTDKNGEEIMVKIKIDGMEYEVSEVLGAKVTEKITALDKANETIAADKKALEELQGKHDALTADLKKKDEEIAKAKDEKPSRKDMLELARARMDLEEFAKKVLGEDAEDLKFDEMDDLAIKKAVIAAVNPDMKLDGATDDYVNGCFSVILDGRKAGTEKTDELAEGLRNGAGKGTKGADPEAARQGMMKRDSQAWQQGLVEEKK